MDWTLLPPPVRGVVNAVMHFRKGSALRRCSHWKILAVLLVAITAFSAVAGESPTPRILMVGDSWAWFMFINHSLRDALADCGLGQYIEEGAYSTVPGSTVAQWTNPLWLAQITTELERNPSIDIVHLSLTGNDFLNEWTIEMSEADRDALFSRIVGDLETVVRHCLSIRPDIRVAIVGYDYINKSKGRASFQQLNEAGMILAGMQRDLAARLERCEYIQSYGAMHHYFGFPPTIPPGRLPLPGQAPDFQPWPGGDRKRGNPPEAMFDDIHLSMKGYYYLGRLCVDALYRRWLTEEAPPDAPHTTSKEQPAAVALTGR